MHTHIQIHTHIHTHTCKYKKTHNFCGTWRLTVDAAHRLALAALQEPPCTVYHCLQSHRPRYPDCLSPDSSSVCILCMYVCVYVSAYVRCVHIIYAQTHRHTHTHTHIYALSVPRLFIFRKHIRICMYVCMYLCMYAYVYACPPRLFSSYTYMHIHTYIRICMASMHIYRTHI
jgi:hypothetical protein